jgi:hypothetical protein
MSADGGFGRDSGTPRRRMLPAVTEVVRELARTVSADPAVLFKAARAVVADELAKVKQGFESAPLDVLVRRARRQLEQEGVAAPLTENDEEPKSVSIAAPPLKPKTPPSHGEDPFQGAGAADLDWEKHLDIQPDDAPFRSAILPLPPRSRVQGIALPERTAVPPAPPPSISRLPVPDRVVAPEGLAVERSGGAPRPKPGLDDLPLFSSPTLELSSPLAPAPPPPPSPAAPLAPPPDVPETPAVAEPPAAPEPPAFPEIPALVQPPSWPRREPSLPRFEPPAPGVFEPEAPPAFEPPSPRFEPAVPRIEPPVRSMSEMPPLAHVVGDVTEPVEPAGPAMGEFAFKAAEAAPPKRKSGKTGWIVAVAVVLAVAAGLLWAVRTFLSGEIVKKVEAPAPAPLPKKREAAPVPAPAATAPAPVPAAATAPVKAAPPARATPAPKAAAAAAPSTVPVPKGKAALLLTPDWTGKPVVYVVHFSSHKDRPSAEKEAKRLAALLGKPGRAVEVDLGNKGVWYRVVIGEFPTVDEARAYRAELEAKKTPDLGFVYEMRGR